MAGERFGALDLAATMDTVLMDSTAGFDSTVNVRFVNRNSTPVMIRLALVDAVAGSAIGALVDEDYLEYDTEILANEVLEDTGIVVPQSHSLVVRADSTGVTVIAYGFVQERV